MVALKYMFIRLIRVYNYIIIKKIKNNFSSIVDMGYQMINTRAKGFLIFGLNIESNLCLIYKLFDI